MPARILILALWAFSLGGLFVGYPGVLGTVAIWVFGLLVVSHVAETLFVLGRIRQAPEPFLPSLIKSLVFGHLHNRQYF
ncbi:DUF1145 domain-containing protein [Celeribacter halophilus]|uniref:DUF1145 domain-containing protein n=1 Tax=Celeribacter halophilus TaxID=576117 RepID=A0AAW7XU12_9RHOB|nr:DUF1145 domain-containing protein [Celeribacter halophilus]MDO6456308.1 DUF1145 domain-containing protein [Celeribacter halophilus]